MTTGEWEHLVRNVLPRVKAARQLELAESASVPHMGQDARETMISRWVTTVATSVRSMGDGLGDQMAAFRGWLASHGINPDSGRDMPEHHSG